MTFPRIQRLRSALAAVAAGAALLAAGTAGASPYRSVEQRHDYDHGQRAPAWSDGRYDERPPPRYADPRYGDGRYADPRYDRRYADPRYDRRYADPRYGEGRYDDPRYGDGRYDDPRYDDRHDQHHAFPDRRSAALFRQFDRDRSGSLDVGERAAVASFLRRAARSGDTSAVNTARAARLIELGDQNRDRQLDDRELRAMLGDTSLAQVFAAFDRNSDRMLAYTELDRAPLLRSLRRADLDRSGYLSWQELDEYLSSRRARPQPRSRVRWTPLDAGHLHYH